MITRKGLADEVDRIASLIDEMQSEKAQMYASYREQLAREGLDKPEIKAELEALKLAIRRRRALAIDSDSVQAHEQLASEILTEIMAEPSAQPRTRARAREAREDGIVEGPVGMTP